MTFQPGEGITGSHLTTRASVPGLSPGGVRRLRRERQGQLPRQRRPHRHHDHPRRHPRLTHRSRRREARATPEHVAASLERARRHAVAARDARTSCTSVRLAGCAREDRRRHPDALAVEGLLDPLAQLPLHAEVLVRRALDDRPGWSPTLPVTDSTPATVGGSTIFSFQPSSSAIAAGDLADEALHPRDVLGVGHRHVDDAGRPALAVVADPQDLAVADVPDDAASRRAAGSPAGRPPRSVPTVPMPVSTRSPTPYWSSRIRKMPDRKSFTSDWAPKPTATPTMPALASSGPIGSPTTSRIIRTRR